RTGCRSPFSPGSFFRSTPEPGSPGEPGSQHGLTTLSAMAQKVILDVDTGTDDAVAIMFAALHPELELVAVTTVNGNVPVEHTTDNTLRVLDFIGRSDVPVHRGLSRPLVREDFPAKKDYASGSS